MHGINWSWDNYGGDFGFDLHASDEVGSSLHFDGSNDFVGISDNDLWAYGSDDFTIELWANFDAPGVADLGHPGDELTGFGGPSSYTQTLEGDRFARTVGMAKDTSIAGIGAAYFFERDGSGTWSEVAKVQASDKEAFDRFGSSVALSGDRALVGARGEDTGASNAGAPTSSLVTLGAQSCSLIPTTSSSPTRSSSS